VALIAAAVAVELQALVDALNLSYGLLPPLLPPVPLLLGRLEGPGNKAALLLALGHFHGLHLQRAGLLQRAIHAGQVARFGDQAAEPQHLLADLGTFLNQLADKRRFATFAPQLRRLTAEVQQRQLAFGVEFAEVAPFAFAAAAGFFGAGVE